MNLLPAYLRGVAVALVAFLLLSISRQSIAQEAPKDVPADDALPGGDGDLEDIAQLFIEKGQFAEALELFDEMGVSNSGSFDILDAKIDLCSKIPSCEGRRMALLAELKLLADTSPTLELKARRLYVVYAQDLKKPALAREGIRLLLKLKADIPSYWLLLADYHEQSKEFRKLDTMLASLTKRFPKSAEVWFRVADRAMSKDDRTGTRHALNMSKRFLRVGDKELRARYVALDRDLSNMLNAEAAERKLEAEQRRQEREAAYREYRQDTRWADLEDDFARSTYL